MHYSKEAALQREKYLKSGAGREWFKKEVVDKPENFEPASVLLKRIRKEKERLIKEKKIKRDKNASIIYRGDDNSYYEKILATGEVKCIDEEIPFEIPKGWEWTRIGNIFNHASGKQQSSSNKGGGTPQKFITTSNLYWGYFFLDNVKIMNFTDEEIKTCSATKGDLLVCEGGAGYGRSAIWNEAYDICLQNHVHRLRPCISGICEYVYHFIYLLKESNNLASVGTAMPGLSASRLKGLLLPFPPLLEQKRIVAELEELLPWIDKYSRVQSYLDELNTTIKNSLKKSILQEAIQGKLVPQIDSEGTAQELLQQIKAEKQILVKENKLKKSALNDSVIFRGDDNKYYEQVADCPICIDEFLPFQIPETWVWCKIKDLLDIQTGASFKKEQANANKKGIRILRGGNILPNKYIFKDDDVFVAKEFVNENTLLKRNYIITPAVTSLENIGKMTVVEKDYNDVSAGGFVFIIRPYLQEFTHSLLIAFFLQSPFLIEMMRGITKKSGAAFYNLGKERLKELYIPLPPFKEQQRIIQKIEQLMQLLK